jgi:hypothetical protein
MPVNSAAPFACDNATLDHMTAIAI